MHFVKRFVGIVSLCARALAYASPSRADVWCTLSNVVVEVDEFGGAYAHGNLAGSVVSYIALCGTTSTETDCNLPATARRLAVALAAQAGGRNLDLYFVGLTSCAQYQAYSRPRTIRMSN
jgi:hypothetical protein